MSVYDRLAAGSDAAYGDFLSRLVPGIPRDRIIGVRTPAVRAVAKELFGTKEADEFLAVLPHGYYEENLVHFFLIAMIKDFDECAGAVERFLPFVDCWPVCDQSSPKAFSKNHEKLLPLIKKWIASDRVYTARFGIRMLMNEFLGEDFKPEYLELVAAKEGGDYYLKMMKAWFFATALAYRFDEAIIYAEPGRLDEWTRKKTIRKALESFRVSEEHKARLKELNN